MNPRTALVPTQRTAALVIGAAPCALLIAAFAPGAWVVAPALGAALLLVVLADALLAGPVHDLAVTAPSDVEIGAETAFRVRAGFGAGTRGTVRCALAADPRLLPGGRAVAALEPGEDGQWAAAVPCWPSRRGTGAVETVWLNWTGPLGLGARQVARAVGQPVRV